MSLSYPELVAAIKHGENPGVEFKEKWSQRLGNDIAALIAAFANSEGGVIVFGVSDDRRPVGCKLTSDERDSVSRAAARCRPQVKFSFHEIEGDGLVFTSANVPRSSIVHCDPTFKFPYRIGGIIDYLDTGGVLSLFREREVTGEKLRHAAAEAEPAARRALSPNEIQMFGNALKSNQEKLVASGLRDLGRMAFGAAVLSETAFQDGVKKVLKQGNDECLQHALEVLRVVAFSGTEEERHFLSSVVPALVAIGHTRKPEQRRQVLDVLLYAHDPAAAGLICDWIREVPEPEYSGTNIQFVLQQMQSYITDHAIRSALYDLLSQGPDVVQTKRIAELLQALPMNVR